MTAPLFLVEWDPTTDTAHVRATFDTVTAEETVAGLDQFAACMRKLREIDNLTGVSGRAEIAPGVDLEADDDEPDPYVCANCSHSAGIHAGAPVAGMDGTHCRILGCTCGRYVAP